MSEVVDQRYVRAICLAAQLGWTHADVYRASHPSRAEGSAGSATGSTDKQPLDLTRASRPESLAIEARLRLLECLGQRLQHLVREREDDVTPDPPTYLTEYQELGPDELLIQHWRVHEWLTILNDQNLLDAYEVGIEMSDLIQAPWREMPARFAGATRTIDKLNRLDSWMLPGSAKALTTSIGDWQARLEDSDEPTRLSLHGSARLKTAMMWQLILFGHGMPIGDDQEKLILELAGEVRWVLVLGTVASIFVLLLLGTVAVYALVSDGEWYERLAAAIIGIGGLAATAWAAITERGGRVWRLAVKPWLNRYRIRLFYEGKLESAFDTVEDETRALSADDAARDKLRQSLDGRNGQRIGTPPGDQSSDAGYEGIVS